MNYVTERLHVFFLAPFWIGIFERIENGKLSVCKVIFGAEPTDGEIYDFILKKYCHLKFSLAVQAEKKKARCSSQYFLKLCGVRRILVGSVPLSICLSLNLYGFKGTVFLMHCSFFLVFFSENLHKLYAGENK